MVDFDDGVSAGEILNFYFSVSSKVIIISTGDIILGPSVFKTLHLIVIHLEMFWDSTEDSSHLFLLGSSKTVFFILRFLIFLEEKRVKSRIVGAHFSSGGFSAELLFFYRLQFVFLSHILGILPFF